MRVNQVFPVLACLCLLAGCGDKEKVVEANTNNTSEEVVPVTGEESTFPYFAPFTGMGVANEITQRPMLAFHISRQPILNLIVDVHQDNY